MSQLPLDPAAAELQAAASLADVRAAGDPFSPWLALAGQLRLVAAALSPAPETEAPSRLTPTAHTAAALDRLDRLDRLDAQSGLEGLDFWRRHARHLHSRAAELSQSSGAPKGQS